MTRRGGGTGRGRPALTHTDFLSRVLVRQDGCWGWRGRIDAHGYARFATCGVTKRWQRAYIYSYEHYVGPVPEGFVLDHFKCDRRWCVNYEHVRPATPKENTLRGTSFSAVNARKTECPACGGPYKRRKDGRRFCSSCRAAGQARRQLERLKL